MILSFVAGLTATKGLMLLAEGSALAITTFYTAKSAKNSKSRR